MPKEGMKPIELFNIQMKSVDNVVDAAIACADGKITKAQFYAEFDKSFFRWKEIK